MANKFDLDALRASNYVNAASTHLRKAFELEAGYAPEDSATDDEIRTELQKLNALVKINAAAPLPQPEGPKGIGRIPNLGPQGKWEGKCMRVTIFKSDDNSLEEAIGVGWSGYKWTIKYDETVDMPWPYWNALLDAVLVDDCSSKAVKWSSDANGQSVRTVTPIRKARYKYQVHGVTPGTENLPEGYMQFFQSAADRTGIFADAKPAMLLMIHDYLFDGGPVDKAGDPVQLDPTQLRLRIAQRLGTPYVRKLQDEIYSAA